MALKYIPVDKSLPRAVFDQEIFGPASARASGYEVRLLNYLEEVTTSCWEQCVLSAPAEKAGRVIAQEVGSFEGDPLEKAKLKFLRIVKEWHPEEYIKYKQEAEAKS